MVQKPSSEFQPEFQKERPFQPVKEEERIEGRDLSEPASAVQRPAASSKKSSEIPEAPARSTSRESVVSELNQENYRKIEEILEADLAEAFSQMPPAVQADFKETGETVIREILKFLPRPEKKSGKINDMIANWLKKIPKVNRFFVIQEAKNKTEAILAVFSTHS